MLSLDAIFAGLLVITLDLALSVPRSALRRKAPLPNHTSHTYRQGQHAVPARRVSVCGRLTVEQQGAAYRSELCGESG